METKCTSDDYSDAVCDLSDSHLNILAESFVGECPKKTMVSVLENHQNPLEACIRI